MRCGVLGGVGVYEAGVWVVRRRAGYWWYGVFVVQMKLPVAADISSAYETADCSGYDSVCSCSALKAGARVCLVSLNLNFRAPIAAVFAGLVVYSESSPLLWRNYWHVPRSVSSFQT